MTMTEKRTHIEHLLTLIQSELCEHFEAYESQNMFQHDQWQRPTGGRGDTRVMKGNETFEQVGINFSSIHGQELPASATHSRPHLQGRPYHAAGISVICHPLNPYVPSTHMNIRIFHVEMNEKEDFWWIGGGFDLTPYYGFREDGQHWHRCAKQTCETFDIDLYPKFKKQCDDYFYLPHRQEHRGLGGIFFDDFSFGDFQKDLSFLRAVSEGFCKGYFPIVQKRMKTPFTEKKKQFMLMRRGRYVEFNLLYDRGTLFGLQSGGRTESILMSLPPRVHWEYDWKPISGSPEEELIEFYLKPQNWI